jgi:uroporphyrinogen decarboxylase
MRMTSLERMSATVRHQPVDRVPCDFSAEPGTLARLYDYFGIHSLPELLRILGIDRWTVRPRYIGPPLRRFPDGSYEAIVSGGPIMLDVPAPVGGVNPTTIRYPWADVRTAADLEGRYGWNGHIDWWDFSSIPAQLDALESQGSFWISVHGDPSGLQHLMMWVGDERFLFLLAEDPDLAVAMIEQHNRYRLEHALNSLAAGGGRIHELHGGGDYSSQIGLLISPRMFRRYFKEIYRRFYREIKANFDVEIFFHSCGAVAELIPDLIEVGVTILDPIQVGARGMEIESLAARFGDRLTFHGGVDIQELLPHGIEADVRREARRLVALFAGRGGYILAPSHSLQMDTPIGNILAMYEEAQGRTIRLPGKALPQ